MFIWRSLDPRTTASVLFHVLDRMGRAAAPAVDFTADPAAQPARGKPVALALRPAERAGRR